MLLLGIEPACVDVNGEPAYGFRLNPIPTALRLFVLGVAIVAGSMWYHAALIEVAAPYTFCASTLVGWLMIESFRLEVVLAGTHLRLCWRWFDCVIRVRHQSFDAAPKFVLQPTGILPNQYYWTLLSRDTCFSVHHSRIGKRHPQRLTDKVNACLIPSLP